jgi:hypothetical protein
MPDQSTRVRDLDPAQNQFAPTVKSMRIKTMSDAKFWRHSSKAIPVGNRYS